MGKIRYLSDGALRYIKSRLDSIEKKIDGNISNNIYGNIVSIKSNKFILKYDHSKQDDVAIIVDSDIINGNIVIKLDDGSIYTSTIYCKDDIIYSNNDAIGQFVISDSKLEIHIGFRYKDIYINLDRKYDINKITNIQYLHCNFIDEHLITHTLSSTTNFEDFVKAKIITIDNINYSIKNIIVGNKTAILSPISFPLNYTDSFIIIKFDDTLESRIKIRDNKSQYISINY